MDKAPLLHCLQLSKSYHEGNLYIDILNNVNFVLEYSEMIAIIGSSGSGKSTLLHLLGGLDKPTGGEIIFEGQLLNNLSSTARAMIRNKRIGFIYQFHHLLPDFTALENVAMPLMIGGANPAQAQEIARKMLVAVDLEKYGHHRPAELSGGERQRVAIARAIANNPALVLADEPTGNLDRRNADIIFELIRELNICQGTAFLVVTHDLKLAERMHRQLEIRDGNLQADRIFLESI